MRLRRSLCALVAVLLVACSQDVKTTLRAPEILYVLPLGDSITQADRHHQSYRYPLWVSLVQNGVQFDFVGSLTEHSNGKGPAVAEVDGRAFDPDHEGYWGLRADEVLEKLREAEQHYPVDIALVHLGTNDVLQGQPIESTVQELKTIIETLRTKNPSVSVLLARPGQSTWSNAKALPELAEAVSELGPVLDSPTSRVIVVPIDTVLTPDKTYDALHPNPEGESLIAEAFFKAMLENGLIPR